MPQTDMFSSLSNALAAVKDRALEACAKTMVNQQIEKFGQVTELHIDSQARTVSAQLALNGEPATIEIQAGQFEVIQENGQSFISFRNFRASREWLGGLLNQYIAGRRFPVPEAVRAVL